MIFVDTSAWYSRYVPKDPNHAAAKSLDDQPHEDFVTTDYVVDELLTLLKARGNVGRAIEVGNALSPANLLILSGFQSETSIWRGSLSINIATRIGASPIASALS